MYKRQAILSLHFKFPDASRAFQDKALDIILVNKKSARRPSDAQALAQANLDGGGNTDENRRVKTPLPPSEKQQSGSELEQAQKRVQALESQQERLLAKSRSKTAAPPKAENEAQPEPVQGVSGRDLANRALEMARLQGEIDRNSNEYNKRPRPKHIGTRADEYRFARYVEAVSYTHLDVYKRQLLVFALAAPGKRAHRRSHRPARQSRQTRQPALDPAGKFGTRVEAGPAQDVYKRQTSARTTSRFSRGIASPSASWC